ncbi:MAG TPA: hypothetical protein VFM51_09205 [Solirubrobacterales bacterium]|nr:hypothetical protein [Solirubrobacterales bacterium]
MEGAGRDSTQDWVVPRGTVPTVSELEARIDEALVLARASEEGVREVGEMALDAARQARRAAEAAEQSARAAAQSARPAGLVAAGDPPPPAEQVGVPPTTPPAGRDRDEQPPQPRFESRLRSFTERADRVAARLRALEEHPRHPGAPSVGAARLRGDG